MILLYIEISNAEEEGELKKIASLTLSKWKYFYILIFLSACKKP